MLSLPKILLTLAIAAAVLIGYRWFKGLRTQVKNKNRAPAAIDLVKCAVCEKFVNDDAGPCQRADCPQV